MKIPLLSPSKEAIAIVGMSCRFPKAKSLTDFWEMLVQGRDAITEIPEERWNIEDYYDADATATNKTNQRHGGMLENIHDFDPLFFNISPAEAIEMNPSQKLLLELTWEAIENSGMPYKHVQGKKAGVYVGNIWSDFEHLRKHKNAEVTSHSAVGQSSNIIANRVSFSFGFTGPSLVVDTGCSSSLVALHIACQGLWDGSTEMAVAAGINHILDPDQYILLTKFGGLSSKGKCSTFDNEADGFVRSEGAGVILLKTLSKALEDGDNILALIRGTAMNNNGYNVNLPATSVAGQKQVLADAYKGSGIHPKDVHYVEAHGTGTKLGDPTESKALGEFFGAERGDAKLRIGSVKTNIGHLEAAAGIAGLIKVVLAINNKVLPSSLNFKTPNPTIPFDELKLQVQATATPWPAKNDETLKAGINSFGWGGTNAHTVLEEYRTDKTEATDNKKRNRYCLPISAKSPAALEAYIQSYRDAFQNSLHEEFGNLCIAASIAKPSFNHRTLFSAATKEEMLVALHDFVEDAKHVTPQKLRPGKNKIVMIFPGQGSQWLGMGQELLIKEPTFKETIEACDRAFKPFTDWSLLEQLNSSTSTSRLDEINVIQPMLFAMQVALANLWISWGVRPDAVVGHSMGEVAAAHIAGALKLEDAARIICTRSALMRTVSGQGGAMVVTELSLPDAEKIVKQFPRLSIAVSNSPKSTVLAGDQESVTDVMKLLEKENLFCRQVKVDVASHSQQMDPLKEPLHKALQSIEPQANSIPVFSSVKMKFMEGEEMGADYWVSNLRSTVQFSFAMQELMDSEHTLFIEASPHPVLTNAVLECAQHFKAEILSVPSLVRDKPEHTTLFKNLGDLYTGGYEMPWEQFYKTDKVPRITLPNYPFQRDRYEIEDKSSELSRTNAKSKYPLLGEPIRLADSDHFFFWETQVSLDLFPYMKDHQVNDTVVLPGVTYLEMVLEATSEIYTHGVPVVSNLKFIKSINLTREPVTIQLKISQTSENDASFQFFQRTLNTSGKTVWVTLAEGNVTTKSRQLLQATKAATVPDCNEVLTGVEYYQSLKSLGLQYGDYFQGIKQIAKTVAPLNEVHFIIEPDDRLRKTFSKYKFHPTLLDSILQPLFYDVAKLDGEENERTTLLSEIGEVSFVEAWDYTGTLRGMAVVYPYKEDLQRGLLHVEADILVYNQSGTLILKIKSLKAKIIDSTLIEKHREKLNKWLYKINWIKKVNELAEVAEPFKGSWVVFGDPYGISEILIDKMAAAGMQTILVSPGNAYSKINFRQYTINYAQEEDYATLMADLFSVGEPGIEGIVHAASISYNWIDPPLTADSVEAQQIFGSISFMYLHQRLTALKLFEIPRLVIVTNGIQTVGIEKDIAQPVHSPLWGMAKVMFNELTQYNCRYLDLSSNPSLEEFEQLINHIKKPLDFENEIALRGKDSYVPRLAVYHQEEYDYTEKRKQFSSEGTYLITGFKGLGFHFIEWMIKQGARCFALVSRTGEASPEVIDKIEKYSSLGCTFRIFCADSGNYNELKTVIDLIDYCLPPLKGVVHAAGVIEAKTLTDLDQEGFLRILSPKVKGAWNLHLLTLNKSLDCFIMFSSASTLIGLSGQGSYVAANAFLDTLAQSRKSMGLPGMSINWGVIKDVGMVSNEADLEKYARAEGFEPVTMRDALEVFNTIYDSEHTQIGIVKLHAESMATYYSSLAKTQYFKGLLKQGDTSQMLEKKFLIIYHELQSTEEKTIALEQLITQHVSAIVKTPVSRINPSMTFKGMGIDSLMAIQLRNLLEKSLDLKLSVAMFWTHPSIAEHADYLFSLLQNTSEAVSKEERKQKMEWFVRPAPNSNAPNRLFLFHDAGGSTSLFTALSQQLANAFDIVCIELPGRGHRINEEMHTHLSDLLEELIPEIVQLMDKPSLFFGHSMGGVLAFELARELAERKEPQPIKLFLSSTPGLTTYSKSDVDYTLPDDELYKTFPHMKPSAIGDVELHTILMKMLRADLKLLDNYVYIKKDQLHIPIVTVYGDNDSRVKREQAERWRYETSGIFKLINRPGGHRYIEQDTAFLNMLLREELNTFVGQR